MGTVLLALACLLAIVVGVVCIWRSENRTVQNRGRLEVIGAVLFTGGLIGFNVTIGMGVSPF